jgi:hypothetical protein
MPVLAVAAPPSGRVAIMNAHSGLCLSPAGGARTRMAKSSNSRAIKIHRVFGALRWWTATSSRSLT